MNSPVDFTSNKQVLDALNKASELLGDARRKKTEPIAVIGMACRLPGAPDLDSYWNLLKEGNCAISQTPADRWNRDELTCSTPKTPGKIITDRAGFIEDVDQFDSQFFEITRREASSLDPQQRILLETAWRTLEHANIPADKTSGGRNGVFVGICSSDYLSLLNQSGHEKIDAYHGTGNAHGTAAGRLSYFLKWEGPCMAIDTACSSSLVATHQAISALRSDDCDMAMVAGVNLILTPDLSINLSQAGMLSPSGLCQAFAANADGFVRGEGCGAVLLKRLSDAQRDGDRIICCLRGSAVNQDGRSNGLTAPNGLSQQKVIRSALKRSGLKPDDIDYVEAHGTGTELGDPIEIRALGEVFAQRERPILVGSAKTNIGHLEGAAGIAGLIKTCLAISHRQLPKHLHFDQPSEHIDWTLPIEITSDGKSWTAKEQHVRRAGVSSFGFGGTNAHVVVEDAPPRTVAKTEPSADLSIVKLSAKSKSALKLLGQSFINTPPEANIADIAAAANLGRDNFEHRMFVIASSRDDLIAQLSGDDAEATDPTLQKIGEQYLAGVNIAWEQHCSPERRTSVSLPGHPFITQRCWIKDQASQNPTPSKPVGTSTRNPLLGQQLDIAGNAIVFESDVSKIDYLKDHCLRGEPVLPATSYIEQALAAAERLTGRDHTIHNLQLHRPLVIGDPCRIQIVLEPNDDGYSCSIQHRTEINWQEHASMLLVPGSKLDHASTIWEGKSQDSISPADHYAKCEAAGIQYGPAFRGLVGLMVHKNTTSGVVELPAEAGGLESHLIHPAILDACFQTLAPLIPEALSGMWLPVSIGELSIAPQSTSLLKLYVSGELEPTDDESRMIGHLQITDPVGQPIGTIKGLNIQRVSEISQGPPTITSVDNKTVDSFRRQLTSASDAQREQLVLEFAQTRVAEIADLELDEVDVDSSLTTLGLDSIMAIELQTVIERSLSVTVPMDLFLKDLSLRALLREIQRNNEYDGSAEQSSSEDDDMVEGAL